MATNKENIILIGTAKSTNVNVTMSDFTNSLSDKIFE
ncbi:hypothetical protein FHS18_000109 [Paenibacillus phyllosphaerae]|uniref:Uncharacterized protein n=1 Tax=Paenibacillus phyllosphaerae TaxID=274593 RepID=A0A7W5ATX2_9BACL|nr:hypothetical protein [Paenibacillus phyllosphaerae]